METITIQKALDDLEKLSHEDQEYVIDLIKKRNIEKRREEIYQNGIETIEAIERGDAMFGSIEDLKKDLSD